MLGRIAIEWPTVNGLGYVEKTRLSRVPALRRFINLTLVCAKIRGLSRRTPVWIHSGH